MEHGQLWPQGTSVADVAADGRDNAGSRVELCIAGRDFSPLWPARNIDLSILCIVFSWNGV